jgi:hypothetical protein
MLVEPSFGDRSPEADGFHSTSHNAGLSLTETSAIREEGGAFVYFHDSIDVLQHHFNETWVLVG